jgi:hypothetical protein
MNFLTARLQAIVAPAHGSGNIQQLPRTRQDVVLEETGRPAITPVVANMPTIRRDNIGNPLSGRTLYGDELDEPHGAQQNVGNLQERREGLAVDSENREEEWPIKYPVAPQHCGRWGKPGPYVIFDLPTRFPDGT